MYKARIDKLYRQLADPSSMKIFAFKHAWYYPKGACEDFSTMIYIGDKFVSQESYDNTALCELLRKWAGASVELTWQEFGGGGFRWSSEIPNMPKDMMLEYLEKNELPESSDYEGVTSNLGPQSEKKDV